MRPAELTVGRWDCWRVVTGRGEREGRISVFRVVLEIAGTDAGAT